MEPKNEKDRRIVRTRHELTKALFDLIMERGYEEITVQDITERANVGRATFYLHYKDKEKLLTASLERLVDEFKAYIEPNTTSSPSTYKTLSVRVFQHIATRCDLYRALLGKNGPPIIAITMKHSLAVLIQTYVMVPIMSRAKEKADPELLATYSAGSLLTLLVWWLDHDLSPSAQEMGTLFFRLITPGIEDVLGIEHRQE